MKSLAARGAPLRVLVTVPEAAAALSLSPRVVWRLMRTGELPSVRINSNRRLAVEDLEAFVADRRMTTTAR